MRVIRIPYSIIVSLITVFMFISGKGLHFFFEIAVTYKIIITISYKLLKLKFPLVFIYCSPTVLVSVSQLLLVEYIHNTETQKGLNLI